MDGQTWCSKRFISSCLRNYFKKTSKFYRKTLIFCLDSSVAAANAHRYCRTWICWRQRSWFAPGTWRRSCDCGNDKLNLDFSFFKKNNVIDRRMTMVRGCGAILVVNMVVFLRRMWPAKWYEKTKQNFELNYVFFFRFQIKKALPSFGPNDRGNLS